MTDELKQRPFCGSKASVQKKILRAKNTITLYAMTESVNVLWLQACQFGERQW